MGDHSQFLFPALIRKGLACEEKEEQGLRLIEYIIIIVLGTIVYKLGSIIRTLYSVSILTIVNNAGIRGSFSCNPGPSHVYFPPTLLRAI